MSQILFLYFQPLASVKEINQELEEYARKYEAIQRHRRSANSPLTDRPTAVASATDRHRLWSRQDSTESNRGGDNGQQNGRNGTATAAGEAINGGEREDMGRLLSVSAMSVEPLSGSTVFSSGKLLFLFYFLKLY